MDTGTPESEGSPKKPKKRDVLPKVVRVVEDATEHGGESPTDAGVAAFVGVTTEDLERLEIDLKQIRRYAGWLKQNRLTLDRPPQALRKRVVSDQLDELSDLLERAPWVTRDNLARAGEEGFTNALRLFDPARLDSATDETFEPFARKMVRAAMLAEEWRLAPPPLRRPRIAITRSVRFAAARFVEEMLARGDDVPSEADVAGSLGLSTDDLDRAQVDLHRIQLHAEWLKMNRSSFDQPPRDIRTRVLQIQRRRFLARGAFWIDGTSGEEAFEQALRGFDPRRGRPFEPYAHTTVKNALLAEVNAGFPRELLNTLSTISQAEQSLRKEHGREPTTDEVAERARLTVEGIEDARRAASLLRPDQPRAYEGAELEASGGFGPTTLSDVLAAFDAGEWIERGISGPRDVRTSQVTLEALKHAVKALPGGHIEVCYWLEGTWDYLARTSQRHPAGQDLATALGFSAAAVEAASSVMSDLLSARTVPVMVPDAPELPRPGALGEETAEAYASLPAKERAVIDWHCFHGPVPRTIVELALRSARTRIGRALEAREPSEEDLTVASALGAPVGLPVDSSSAGHRVDAIRWLTKTAVRAYLGFDAGPLMTEQQEAVTIIEEAIRNPVKQRVKRAVDRFTRATMLNVVEWSLTVRQRDALIRRYRDGQHRIDLTGLDHLSYMALYRKLRQRLLVNGLLPRIFVGHELKFVDSRYRWDTPQPVCHTSDDAIARREPGRRWVTWMPAGRSVNWCLALEFERMQEVLAVIAPLVSPGRRGHKVKLEPPHALLPEQLEIARLFFHEGVPASTVADQVGMGVPTVEQALWDVVETQRWLFDGGRVAEGQPGYSRYLNLGGYQPANGKARTELARACEGGTWEAAAPAMTALSRDAICAILHLGQGHQ